MRSSVNSITRLPTKWHVVEEGIVGIAIALVYGKPGAVELNETT